MKTRIGWLIGLSLVVGCTADGDVGAGTTTTAGPGFTTTGGGSASTTGTTGGATPTTMGAPTSTTGGPAVTSGTTSSTTGTMADAGTTGGPTTGGDTGTTGGNCAEEGLELEGLMYSPGGTKLPFPCEPFHPTTNNPYAIRCVDAWPWYETQFAGDEFCILPPEPGKGIQIGVHPQGEQWYEQVSQGDLSGYDDPPDEFLMAPGEEEERNYLTSSPNDEPIKFYREAVRMRIGSHHMIVSAAANMGEQREVWLEGSPIEGLFGGNSLPGAQRPDENVPKTLEKPGEDKGLYRELAADQNVTYNMHHFNSTEDVILKEAWENLWFEEEATVPVVPMFGMPLTQVIGTFANPGEEVDIHHSFSIAEDVRLVQLFGHRHVWTTNFTAWVERSDGSEEILYQSFDWFDQPTYRYDSLTQNPAPASDKLLDGGYSGHMTLEAGDELHFNCHMNYTDERAAAEGAPTPGEIGPLRFANQAFEGEMCILFGSTAGTGLGRPTQLAEPVPDFASID